MDLACAPRGSDCLGNNRKPLGTAGSAACFVSADAERSRPYRRLMRQIDDRDAALAVLTDPAFVVPPVAPASAGVAWLRATVGRFSTGEAHERRRALSIAILDAIP